MARPIKETPVLTGEDARRFEKVLAESEQKKVSRESYERALKAFESIKSQSRKVVEA